MKKVNLFWPNIHKELWLEELGKIFDSKWIAQAGKVKEFETEFGKKFDYDYCVALNSGTAALELAFYLLNLKPGDFVLTPVLTCTATNIPLVRKITSNGILFIDINENLSMNWGSFIENIDRLRMIGVKPKAVVTVNLGGITCDDRIYEYCRENNIPVVVDACQSLGIKEPNGDFVCYRNQLVDVKGFPLIIKGSIGITGNPVKEIFKLFPIDRWVEVPEHLNEYNVIRDGRKVILQALEVVYDELSLEVPDEINIEGYEII
jgi:hypothetical protein